MVESRNSINLEAFNSFKVHTWVLSLTEQYRKDAALAYSALERFIKDLEKINSEFFAKHKRVAFTTIEGRVKTQESFLYKLYMTCCKNAGLGGGLTQAILQKLYSEITDVCGVRLSCPYYDEVVPAINRFVRPKLSLLGYSTDLQSEPCYRDKDYLDKGDEFGYRSYHFFIGVPTVVNIYGDAEICVCEVQARTELQHVWAVKSHDLIYKQEGRWEIEDENVVENMRQVSNNLRAADQFLVDIRDRIRGKQNYYNDKI